MGHRNFRSRDPDNGIEDIPNWRYWDGKIIKASDGKYHLFCSKWPVSKGLAAWMSDSVSVHATSDNLLGPYKELGLTYTYQNGKGHNTTGLTLVDGTYAVIESAIVPGWIFTSSSLDGPFNYQGSIKWDNNGFNTDAITSNLQIMVGPDNRYWAISSHGYVMDSDNIVGTYKVEAPRIYPIISGMNDANAEDPVIWYSGGHFHVIYNYWDARRGLSPHVCRRDQELEEHGRRPRSFDELHPLHGRHRQSLGQHGAPERVHGKRARHALHVRRDRPE